MLFLYREAVIGHLGLWSIVSQAVCKIFIGPVSGRSALGEGRWGWGEGDGWWRRDSKILLELVKRVSLGLGAYIVLLFEVFNSGVSLPFCYSTILWPLSSSLSV